MQLAQFNLFDRIKGKLECLLFFFGLVCKISLFLDPGSVGMCSTNDSRSQGIVLIP